MTRLKTYITKSDSHLRGDCHLALYQRGQYPLCKEVLSYLNTEWIIEEFNPPKVDLTR